VDRTRYALPFYGCQHDPRATFNLRYDSKPEVARVFIAQRRQEAYGSLTGYCILQQLNQFR
jgi:hypothetical protein